MKYSFRPHDILQLGAKAYRHRRSVHTFGQPQSGGQTAFCRIITVDRLEIGNVDPSKSNASYTPETSAQFITSARPDLCSEMPIQPGPAQQRAPASVLVLFKIWTPQGIVHSVDQREMTRASVNVQARERNWQLSANFDPQRRSGLTGTCLSRTVDSSKVPIQKRQPALEAGVCTCQEG